MRRFQAIVFTLLCFCIPLPLHAQNSPAPLPAPITLGQSLVPIYGPWKFHIGDSPLIAESDSPLWAAADFDDSRWETVDLKPAANSFDPVAGMANYVPGWTDKGHPGYWGYAWYRTRVRLASAPGVKLAIEGPADVDDAYQLFANGMLLGSFGKFSTTRTPVIYNTRPTIYSLPESDGTQVLAFRVWMEPNTPVVQPDTGGLHTAPVLGEAGVVQNRYQLDWLQLTRAYVNYPVISALGLLLAIVSFGLFFFDRSDDVYLWLAAVLLLRTVDSTNSAVTVWTTVEGAQLANVESAIVIPLVMGGWLMVWWRWFRLQRPAWVPAAIAVLTAAYMLCNLLGQDLFITVISHASSVRFHVALDVLKLLLLLLLVLIVFWGIREQGSEGWLALPAVLLMGLAQFQNDLAVLHIRDIWFPFGVQVTLGTIAFLALIAVLLILMLRRLVLSLQQQRALAADMKHAQEVQHVLLPEPVNVPGLRIQSEYRPAREVGGDFFQIVPHPADGSVLIVAGDVVGKGLQAGMLVALLVGAIRSTAELDSDPKFVLEALNRRLLNRGDARATCLALRIEPSGAVTLANAGHLPPYLNAAELPMEGSLPLGSLASVDFPVSHFQLRENDTLTLVSDGVPEAQDKERRLFGFDRVRELLHARIAPAALAAAAQSFGQQDDISIVSVSRV